MEKFRFPSEKIKTYSVTYYDQDEDKICQQPITSTSISSAADGFKYDFPECCIIISVTEISQ